MAVIVIGKDRDDSSEIRLQNREAHLEFLKSSPFKIKIAGPLLKNGNMVGSVLIFPDVDNVEEVGNFFKNDPYVLANLFASVEISQMKISIDN